MRRICSIDGCDQTVKARGWCQTHYDRWRRDGSPLRGVRLSDRPSELICEHDAPTSALGECSECHRLSGRVLRARLARRAADPAGPYLRPAEQIA